MQTPRFTLALAALLWTIMPIVPLQAQQPDSARPLAQMEDTIDVSFPGGSFEELLQMITRDNSVSINVVASEMAQATEVPALALRNVRLMDVMQALDGLGSLHFNVSGDNILSVTARSRGNEARAVQIYDIRSLVTERPDTSIRFRVDDVVTAMRVAWEMAGDSQGGPSLKFHDETCLLVVYGTDAQQKVAKTVLERLMASQKEVAWAEERERKLKAAASLEKKVEDLTLQVRELVRENGQLGSERARQDDVAAGLRAQMDEIRAHANELEFQNERLRKELADKERQSNN